KIVGLEGIRDAYGTGNGSFKMRAAARIENITARRKGIVITELPFNVAPEKVMESIKKLVQSKKLQGITGLKNLTDRHKGMHLVVEVKNGIQPEALLEQLYKHTPMESSFSINAVALVDGQPRTLTLKQMLEVYLEHRYEVVRRRTRYRRGKTADRLHLVDGLLIAILDIDEVIELVRSSDDRGSARTRLMTVFDLSEDQANHILDLQLGRLTKFSRTELENEADALLAEYAALRGVVGKELSQVAQDFGSSRGTVLLESVGQQVQTPLEVADDPCWLLMSATGLLARTTDRSLTEPGDERSKHDVVRSVVPATARGQIGVIADNGVVHRVDVLDLPTLPSTARAPHLRGGIPVSELLAIPDQIVGLMSLADDAVGIAIGTRRGVVKRVKPEVLGRDSWPVIALDDGDNVVHAVELGSGDEELAFVTSDANLLHYSADLVRPQGRNGGGVAGVRLDEGAHVVAFGAVSDPARASVATVAGTSD